MAGHLVVAGDVFDGVLFCDVLFPHEMSWTRPGITLSQFLTLFLPTFVNGAVLDLNRICSSRILNKPLLLHDNMCGMENVNFMPQVTTNF